MLRLTDEEILSLAMDIRDTRLSSVVELVRDSAKAQLKKVVDIIKRDYPETLFLLEDLKFWHKLLEEVKE